MGAFGKIPVRVVRRYPVESFENGSLAALVFRFVLGVSPARQTDRCGRQVLLFVRRKVVGPRQQDRVGLAGWVSRAVPFFVAVVDVDLHYGETALDASAERKDGLFTSLTQLSVLKEELAPLDRWGGLFALAGRVDANSGAY